MSTDIFHQHADKLLLSLMEALEDFDTIEVDLIDGILTIGLEYGREIVINKHEPTEQIWLSSPLSGASHFAYTQDDDEWNNTRGGESFTKKMSDELVKLVNINITF